MRSAGNSDFRGHVRAAARRQMRSADLAEDICQETLRRVLHYFRCGQPLKNPKRLPEFVLRVCRDVMLGK